MPELPEVESIALKLREVLPGKIVKSLQVLHPKSFAGDLEQLAGQEITNVSRRAKMLHFTLSNSQYLVTHLKMTGQLIYEDSNQRLGGGHPTADWVRNLPSSHTRLIYEFTDNSRLYFNDQRVFGWMRVMELSGLEQEFGKYGPDINGLVGGSRQEAEVAERIRNSRREIKQVLLDQKIIAGLGNIYVCEALWHAKIHPLTKSNTLADKQIAKLLNYCRQVVAHAIELGGTTFDGKYVGTDGFAGGYQNELKVYGREGLPCSRCGRQIEKIRIGGRGTWYCNKCQRSSSRALPRDLF